MIKIHKPQIHHSYKDFHLIDESYKRLFEFFKIPFYERIQRNPNFNPKLIKFAEIDLRNAFYDKCAYCESKIVSDRGIIDRFRPKQGAINVGSKKKDPDHYWWIVYDWENLFLACRDCNFSKGNKFPVIGDRGHFDMKVQTLRDFEKALLIDPTYDEPENHLAFSDDGWVSPKTEMGEISIETFDLNRNSLKKARLESIVDVRKFLDLVIKGQSYAFEFLENHFTPTQPYIAAKKQFLRRIIEENPSLLKKIKENTNFIQFIESGLASTFFVSTAEQNQLNNEFKKRQHNKEFGEDIYEINRNFFYGKTQYISKIIIQNFRSIESLRIELPDPQEGKKPWMVLLGENGMGKSSILKAIALTLMGNERREKINIKPIDVLRNGATEGFVEIHINGYSEPFKIGFDQQVWKSLTPKKVLNTLLFCYGGTRLLPNRKHRWKKSNDDFARVRNLFDQFLPLINANSWLWGLSEEQFGYSAKAIKQMLTNDDEKILVRKKINKRRIIKLESEFLEASDSLEMLSDGYQSVIALTADISEILLKHYDDVKDSEGIVLIDEIDVHLHPRWKTEIVELLRTVFPRIQFIVTTHDPLCLLGTLPGEIHILRRNLETKRVEVRQKDVPAGMTADQVLTGFWFGLRSTIDDETLALLDEHRMLLRNQVGEDDPERLELEQVLRLRLGTFADTSIDRMAQSVASELISERIDNLDIKNRQEIRQNIKEKLKKMLMEKEI